MCVCVCVCVCADFWANSCLHEGRDAPVEACLDANRYTLWLSAMVKADVTRNSISQSIVTQVCVYIFVHVQ